ncbi:MAG: hypothetical protein LBF93_12235 [Zoogloeaceae bacterium]|jgi:formyltetrahydrofolate hydrolase|nr:hypothetical protein [Zoogloeaceae bacterium]
MDAIGDQADVGKPAERGESATIGFLDVRQEMVSDSQIIQKSEMAFRNGDFGSMSTPFKNIHYRQTFADMRQGIVFWDQKKLHCLASILAGRSLGHFPGKTGPCQQI